MGEFKIGIYTYRSVKMDAFTQLDIISKLAPVLSSGISELIPFIKDLQRQSQEGESLSLSEIPMESVVVILNPIAKSFAKMEDADRHFVISACLDLCERKAPGEGYVKVWNRAANRAMFMDLNENAAVLIQIVFFVLKDNLWNFFPEILSGLTAPQ